MKTRVGLGDEILPSYIDFPGLLHKPIFFGSIYEATRNLWKVTGGF